MKKYYFFALILILQTAKSHKILPHPYDTVTILPFDATSHFGPRQAKGLAYVIKRFNPKIVLEVGSYLGASTRYIAKLLPSDGKVYAVDHWLGNDGWKNDPKFAEKQALFYQKFLSNIIHANLCHKVIPIKMDSLAAAQSIEAGLDLVFLDGSHDYKSVYADICAWYPFIQEKGILSGDDYNWGAGRPVKKAVDQFAREHKLTVKVIDNWFWYYEKK